MGPTGLVVLELARSSGACGALVNVFDVRLVNYFLEWAYRYFRGGAGSYSLWSPPFFYPTQNVLAYSETLFAAWPFYFPARWLGAAPQTALLIYQLAQLALTPAVTYLCMRWIGFRRTPSFVAAWCFGWSWVRYNQLSHIQFANGYVIVLMLALLYRGFREARPWLLTGFVWAFCCAWYTAFYTAYFTLLVSVLAIGLWTLAGPRDAAKKASRLWAAFRAFPRAARAGWIACAITPAALVAVGAYHYVLAARVVGPGDPAEALVYQATIWSFLRPDVENLLWRRFSGLLPTDPVAPWEKQLFLGWIALACVAVVLVWRRASADGPVSRRTAGAAAASVLLCILLVARFPVELLNRPYEFAVRHLPGFGALRASGRIALVLSALTSLSVAVMLEAALVRLPFLAGLLAAGLVLECTPITPPIADRCQADRPWQTLEPRLCQEARRENVGTVLFLPMDLTSLDRIFDQVPEMTLALECGMSTINGYTGHEAPWAAPLFHSDPRHFNCSAARQAVTAAAHKSGKDTLVYLEEYGPLGPPAYRPEVVPACFSSCLRSRTDVDLVSRRGEWLVLDHTRPCAPQLSGRDTAAP